MSRNRRRHPRAHFPSVRVQLQGGEGARDEFLENLSAGGLFVRTERTLPVGSRLEVQIHRPQAEPLSLQSEVVRLELSEEGLSGMALRFLGVPKVVGVDLERLVEPFVEAFERESAEADLGSRGALEARVSALRERLAELEATRVAIELGGPDDGGADSAAGSGAPTETLDGSADPDREQSEAAARAASLEVQLELLSERNRTERRLRAEVERELSETRLRLRQLEDVQIDKVEVEERLAEALLQLRHARELVLSANRVANDALMRLELAARQGAGEDVDGVAVPPREASTETAVSDAGAGEPVDDDGGGPIVAPPRAPSGEREVGAEPSQRPTPPVSDGEETLALHIDPSSLPPGAGASDREETVVPLVEEDAATAGAAGESDGVEVDPPAEDGFDLDLTGVEDESAEADAPVGHEDDTAQPGLVIPPDVIPLAQRDRGEASSSTDDGPLGAAPPDPGPAAAEDDDGESPSGFVPLSQEAIAAAREGRGEEFSEKTGVDGVLDGEGEGEAARGRERTRTSSRGGTSPAFDWQEETAPGGLRTSELQKAAAERMKQKSPFVSARPTRPLSLDEVPQQLSGETRKGSKEPDLGAALASERSEQAPEPPASQQAAEAASDEPATEAVVEPGAGSDEIADTSGALGPEEIPTRDAFVEHLEAGAELIKTERFHRLEPVSRADISVSDWLARAESYRELQQLAEGSMSEAELQRVLHLFFERGLLVVREAP